MATAGDVPLETCSIGSMSRNTSVVFQALSGIRFRARGVGVPDLRPAWGH